MNRLPERVKLERWPGGHYTISGGTRTAVKLDRPWQVDMEVDPTTCPFCTKKQDVLEDHGDWLVLGNTNTPYKGPGGHRLVIPRACLPKDQLRILGGIKGIKNGLGIAEAVIKKVNRPQMLHSIHCGWQGGQNIAHLHHHVLDNEFSGFESHDAWSEVRRLADSTENRIFTQNGITVVAGGHRAGQCYLIPTHDFSYDTGVGVVLFTLIQLFAEKFVSKQGLPPDYMYSARFRNGKFIYGKYIPILSNWGSTEYQALEGEQPFTLPWPHEETVRHLLARKEVGWKQVSLS